ncbi:MAG TPA: ABC transporter permease [Acidobacteriaceae bacterium]
MRNVFLIARREYLEQVRGRAFRLSTILVPLLFAAIIGIAVWAGKGSGVGKHILIASPNAALANDVRDRILDDKDAKTTVDVDAPAQESDRLALLGKVQSKAVDGLFWIDSKDGAKNGAVKATYTSQSSGDIVITQRLSSALNHSLTAERMTARGMSHADVESLLKEVDIQTTQIDKTGKETKSSGFGSYAKGYIMALLLSMTTLMYGLNTARSIIQEKTSRIFEVMLSIVKPSDMLAGKLIGVGAVGLTQIAIWAVCAIAIAGSALAAPIMSGALAIHFSWVEGILFPLYFVLGFLFYASLFAGLAATCETEQELQMYTPLAAVPVWLSFSLIWLVINNPGSALSIAASLFPATAPIIMMLRMGAQMPPAWQFAASILILILSIVVVLAISTRLYRVGVLMYGKRATLPEIMRWLRYS